ncbi:hypothetical protein, partial [Streptomyces sp. wa22]|uniref:hypothetical protein n=1 Tax=Streptomyces sp. wa22 TaxID=1828244 RepID=UPI001C9C3144
MNTTTKTTAVRTATKTATTTKTDTDVNTTEAGTVPLPSQARGESTSIHRSGKWHGDIFEVLPEAREAMGWKAGHGSATPAVRGCS